MKQAESGEEKKGFRDLKLLFIIFIKKTEKCFGGFIAKTLFLLEKTKKTPCI